MDSEKIRHDWWVKIAEKHTPTYMECRKCGKQVKWWAYHEEIKLDNPFKEGDDARFCELTQG